MLVLLFLLVLLAIAGLLGAVLKAVVFVVATVVLSAVVIGWLSWRAIKRQIAKTERELGAHQTQVEIGRYYRSPRSGDDGPERPLPPVDDRY